MTFGHFPNRAAPAVDGTVHEIAQGAMDLAFGRDEIGLSASRRSRSVTMPTSFSSRTTGTGLIR
jgi:hypothetical protein